MGGMPAPSGLAVWGSAAKGRLRSIRISCVALKRVIGFPAQAGGRRTEWIFSCAASGRS
jgi:hypothetical protein